MAVAITRTTANRSQVEGLNGFVSMRTSIVVRHRNVDGVLWNRAWCVRCPAGPSGQRDVESRKRAVLEMPPRLGKDPALILRADSTAPVFNDEEKRARATTQVHKVARESYRSDVGSLAFWARCDRATTLFAGARHVGVLRLLFARELRL
jgi:hypothetical protein